MVWLHGFDGSVERNLPILIHAMNTLTVPENQNRFYYILARRLDHDFSTLKVPFIIGLVSPSCTSLIHPIV